MEVVIEIENSKDTFDDRVDHPKRSEHQKNGVSKKIWESGPKILIDNHEEYQKVAPHLVHSEGSKLAKLPKLDYSSLGAYKPRSSQIFTSRTLYSDQNDDLDTRQGLPQRSQKSSHKRSSTNPQSRETSLPRLGSVNPLESSSKASVRQRVSPFQPAGSMKSAPNETTQHSELQLQSASSLIGVQKSSQFKGNQEGSRTRRGEATDWDAIRSREVSQKSFLKENRELSEPLPYIGTCSNSMISNLEMMEIRMPGSGEQEQLRTIEELYADISGYPVDDSTKQVTKPSSLKKSVRSGDEGRRIPAKPIKLRTDASIRDQITSPTVSHLRELGSRNTSFKKFDTGTQNTQLTLTRDAISDRTHQKRIGLSNSTPQILCHIGGQIEDKSIKDRMMARESKERFKELATLFKVQQRQKKKYGHLTSKNSMHDDEIGTILGTGSFYDKKMTGSSHQDLSESRSFHNNDTKGQIYNKLESPKYVSRNRYPTKLQTKIKRAASEAPIITAPHLIILEPQRQGGHLASESSEDATGKHKHHEASKDTHKADMFTQHEGPLGPIELSNISPPAAPYLSIDKPKKKVATITSRDDYSFTSHIPSQRMVAPLKGAIKLAPPVADGHRPSKMSLFSIKESSGLKEGVMSPPPQTHNGSLHPNYRPGTTNTNQYPSHRTIYNQINRPSLFRRPSMLHRNKKPLFRSTAEQEALENTLSALRTNLSILRALFMMPVDEFVDMVGNITRNNPCCTLLGRFLKEHNNDIADIKVSVFAADTQMKQNIPLMLADIKEFLIERRVTLLEHLAKSYLSNSVEFMKSSKFYQSALVKKELMKILKDREFIQGDPQFKLTTTDTVRMVGWHHNQRLQDIVGEFDSSKILKLDKVNEYWKESNQMINEFLTQLIHPQDKHHQKVKLPHSLVQEFETMRVQNSMMSFHWEQQETKKDSTQL